MSKTIRARLVNSQQARHGMYGTPTYKSWAAMIGRCKGSKSDPTYYQSVLVCERWLNFRGFYEDMGARPDGTTLDRFPNGAGNYEPGNCRWATKQEQIANRSNAVMLTYAGETLTAGAWAKRIGISDTTVRRRMRAGWPVDKVLSAKDFHCNSGRWAHGPNPQGAGT